MEIESFNVTNKEAITQIAACFPDVCLDNACNTVVVCFESVAGWTSLYCIPIPTPIAIAFAVPVTGARDRGLELTIHIVQNKSGLFALMLDQITQTNKGTTMQMRVPTDSLQKESLVQTGFKPDSANYMCLQYDRMNAHDF